MPVAERRSPRQMSYWLWMLVVGMASAISAFVVVNAFLPADRAVSHGQLGQDFIAFYSAGRLVDSGRTDELYDLDALAALQRSIAAESHLSLASDVAPWFNPPFAAFLFAPFAMFSFNTALAWWTVFNIVCLTAAGWLLMGIIRDASERQRDWLLVPALLAIAPPTLQALGHGQNTCLSLLLLTLCVAAWRARRPMLGGIAWAMLCYKPQLAAIVGVAMFATFGWRFIVGALLALVPALLITIDRMPGTLGAFFSRVPANMASYQLTHPPQWHRHVTFEGLFRALFSPHAGAPIHSAIQIGSVICIACVVALLARAWWQTRSRAVNDEAVLTLSFDRFIALSFLTMPLASPYFVDYDLLLLAVPAVLIAREMMLAPDRSPTARALRVLGPITFIWLAINPPLAGATGLNLTVPLLIGLVALQARRCARLPIISVAIPTERSNAAFAEAPRMAA
jgi:hypothetical protein